MKLTYLERLCEDKGYTLVDNVGGGNCMVYAFLKCLWDSDQGLFRKKFSGIITLPSENGKKLHLSRDSWKLLNEECRKKTKEYMEKNNVELQKNFLDSGEYPEDKDEKKVQEEFIKSWNELKNNIVKPGEWYETDTFNALFNHYEVDVYIYMCSNYCTKGSEVAARYGNPNSPTRLIMGNAMESHFVSLLPNTPEGYNSGYGDAYGKEERKKKKKKKMNITDPYDDTTDNKNIMEMILNTNTKVKKTKDITKDVKDDQKKEGKEKEKRILLKRLKGVTNRLDDLEKTVYFLMERIINVEEDLIADGKVKEEEYRQKCASYKSEKETETGCPKYALFGSKYCGLHKSKEQNMNTKKK
jgi:hypothetical protein